MIHIYTGDGKGKTTAGVGLAIRAAAAGYKVLYTQLLKDGSSSEVGILKDAQNIYYKAFGNGDFVTGKNDVQESKVREGLSYIRTNADKYDVIVIDEAITAVNIGLISESDLLSTVSQVQSGHEIILTGRGATKNLLETADLVTEMKKIKHYHDQGQESRKGIEY